MKRESAQNNTEVGTEPSSGQRSENGTSVITTERLYKRYGKRYVVKDVSITVRQGEVVGLLGPNGAGKTTNFYMIVGLIKPTSGNIIMDGRNITRVPMYKRSRFGIGYLPQEASIFRKLSVKQNIMSILELRKIPRKEREEQCGHLMEEFGLSHLANSQGYMLSGGERRRTEIARSLASDPKFILLDEPFAGIDPIAVEDLMELVRNLTERGIGVLVTDHNVHETLSITSRSYLLFEGSILKSGSAEELANDPQVRKLYLGEKFKLDRY
jgi:lipopolysaccharide export system ATP-binding protein